MPTLKIKRVLFVLTPRHCSCSRYIKKKKCISTAKSFAPSFTAAFSFFHALFLCIYSRLLVWSSPELSHQKFNERISYSWCHAVRLPSHVLSFNAARLLSSVVLKRPLSLVGARTLFTRDGARNVHLEATLPCVKFLAWSPLCLQDFPVSLRGACSSFGVALTRCMREACRFRVSPLFPILLCFLKNVSDRSCSLLQSSVVLYNV